ncbi:MAG: bifunctional hydroxymethylpyrimidine kinase/phosphomethylpyrimidine kinase, partial [Lachnospiraceae bacterium]|nr:bifunctional hydroxymethylpyrimidine kinase/phosphomethylpyrimidine kinase [Lachnospiraceae bacterium]
SLRQLLPHAHVITPNLTESCLLTGTTYPAQAQGAAHPDLIHISHATLEKICCRLATLTPAAIVLTGIPYEKGMANVIYEKGILSIRPVEITGPSRHGTGDAFGAVLTGSLMQGHTIKEAVDTASSFVSLCIATSDVAAIPPQEGLYFEACLKTLL